MNTQNSYLEDERAEMRKKGYITVAEAARMAGVHTSVVYKRINHKDSKIKVQVGANARAKYVRLSDWESYVEDRKERLKAALEAL